MREKPAARTAVRKRAVKKIDAIPGFVPPQLCKLIDRPPSGAEWLHEIKFDGYRIQARIDDGDVSLKTRKGLDWTDKFPAIARSLGSLPDSLIDGEIVALNHDGHPDFSDLQAADFGGRRDRRSDLLCL